MDLLRSPFKGVVADVKGRAPWYKDDWLAGLRAGFGSVFFLYFVYLNNPNQIIFYIFTEGFAYVSSLPMFARILAPTMYIFFASALPVIAFGEQLSNETSKTNFNMVLAVYIF